MRIRFAEWRDFLFLALVEEEEENGGGIVNVGDLADELGYEYPTGWVDKAAQIFEGNGWATITRTIASSVDQGIRTRLTGAGLEAFNDGQDWVRPIDRSQVTPVKEGKHVASKDIESDKESAAPPVGSPRNKDGPLFDSTGAFFTLGSSTLGEAPASDRVVTLDHNSAEYKVAVDAVDAVIDAVRGDNEYGDRAREEKEAVVAALKNGRRLLDSVKVRVSVIQATLLPSLQYIADNFSKGVIAALGAAAVAAVGKLLGII